MTRLEGVRSYIERHVQVELQLQVEVGSDFNYTKSVSGSSLGLLGGPWFLPVQNTTSSVSDSKVDIWSKVYGTGAMQSRRPGEWWARAGMLFEGISQIRYK